MDNQPSITQTVLEDKQPHRQRNGVRVIVDHIALFRPSPAVRLVFALACSAVMVLRAWDLLAHAAFWAEDGKEFYGPAFNNPSMALFLQPYSGYLHLVPRLFAWFAVRFPLVDGPLVMTVLSLAVLVLPLFYLVSDRATFLRIPATRLASALLYALAPIPSEAYGNATNAHWFTCVIMLLILLCEPAKNRVFTALDAAMFVIFSLTGPFAIYVALCAVALGKLRDKGALWKVATLLAGSAVQIIFLMHSGRLAHSVHLGAVAIAVNSVVDRLFTTSTPCWIGVVVWIGLFVTAVMDRNRFSISLFLVAACALVSASMSHGALSWGRYHTLAVIAACLSLTPSSALPHGRGVGYAKLFLIVLFLAFTAPAWFQYDRHEVGYSWSKQLLRYYEARRGAVIDIPVAPGHWGAIELIRK